MIIAPKTASGKPAIVKPSTRAAAIHRSTPFMTNEKSPRVRRRKGKDARRIMGLRKIFAAGSG